MKILLSFLLLVVSFTIYGQSDFSGTWKLDTSKSRFNNTPGSPAANTLVVEQKDVTISLQRDNHERESLKIDSTAETEINNAGSKTKVSMKPTADKKGLIETRIYSYPADQSGVLAAKKIRIWTLSINKKTLTILDHIETTQQGLNYDMDLIYERQ